MFCFDYDLVNELRNSFRNTAWSLYNILLVLILTSHKDGGMHRLDTQYTLISCYRRLLGSLK